VEATFARDPARVATLRVGVAAKAVGPTDQIHCDEVLGPSPCVPLAVTAGEHQRASRSLRHSQSEEHCK
jgi:hypothetical protein